MTSSTSDSNNTTSAGVTTNATTADNVIGVVEPSNDMYTFVHVTKSGGTAVEKFSSTVPANTKQGSATRVPKMESILLSLYAIHSNVPSQYFCSGSMVRD
jgi:hypothetical protein